MKTAILSTFLVCFTTFAAFGMGTKDINNLTNLVNQRDKIVTQYNRVITGCVTDTNGTPLPSVNVRVKGTTNGTTTGPDGCYELTVPDGDIILIFSFIGYKTIEVPVPAGDNFVDVVMERNYTTTLDTVNTKQIEHA